MGNDKSGKAAAKAYTQGVESFLLEALKVQNFFKLESDKPKLAALHVGAIGVFQLALSVASPLLLRGRVGGAASEFFV